VAAAIALDAAVENSNGRIGGSILVFSAMVRKDATGFLDLFSRGTTVNSTIPRVLNHGTWLL